ncbi:MAG: TVP38/TMEM64 family protein [Rhodospirillaceae bacterium]|nr:TVP38/TMEM64 family protein [Rhodospirillaceae bacterium]MDE0616115.1 TVP38/TMEM64 family protein [Rhodospirillaceae bacterium]
MTEPPNSPPQTPPNDRQPARQPARQRWARVLPLVVLLCGLALFLAMGWHRYISFEQLREHREALEQWVAARGILAPVIYGLAYAVMIAFSIPGGAVATMVGGFFFGLVTGSIAVVVSATVGATIVFLAARSALGAILRRKSEGWLHRMEEGFRENAFSYLMVLRLIPLFPFWLVNLVPAFLGVGLRTYVIATFFGIMPGSIVYVSLGNGIGALLESGRSPDLGIIFRAEILLPLVGLAILSMLPVVYKRYQRRKAGGKPDAAPGD